MTPDPRPPARVRDPALLRALHLRWTSCALCNFLGTEPLSHRLSLHHILKRHREDVEAALIMLCGDGVAGHHGLVEHHDLETCRELARYLRVMRPDTFAYLTDKLGGAIAADDWLRRLGTSKL